MQIFLNSIKYIQTKNETNLCDKLFMRCLFLFVTFSSMHAASQIEVHFIFGGRIFKSILLKWMHATRLKSMHSISHSMPKKAAHQHNIAFNPHNKQTNQSML